FSERSLLATAATIGILETPLAGGAVGRVDHAGSLRLRLLGGELASVSRVQLLNGANVLAVRSNTGSWELLQFETVEEVAPASWLLTRLLRGQLGTEDAMEAGAAAGAFAVLIDETVTAAGLRASEIGLPLNWRVEPTGMVNGADDIAAASATGGL